MFILVYEIFYCYWWLSQFVPSFSCFKNLFYTKHFPFCVLLFFLSLHHFRIRACSEKWFISFLYNFFLVWAKNLNLSRGLCDVHKWERFTEISIVPVSRSFLLFTNFKMKKNVIFHIYFYAVSIYTGLRVQHNWIQIHQSIVHTPLLRKETRRSKSDL